jgi:selenide,water dikinase
MEDLVQVLSRLPKMVHPDLLVGIETGDDAAVYRLNDDTALVLTVDFFPPITDDPFEFGAIAAANSLSDVYAMGGKPLLALNIVGFPASLDKSVLAEVLRGGYAKAAEAGCLIVGGHTVDDPEPKYGLSVVGLVHPGRQVTNAGARPGDVLVLTKPLGTGIITTAGKQRKAPKDVLQGAVAAMSALNQAASQAMVRVGAHACTDITGFGLLGHLRSMVRGSGVAATVRLGQVPVLPGAWELLDQGVAPGGTHRNLKGVGDTVQWHPALAQREQLLLCDAQTSGGLLIAVAKAKEGQLLRELEAAGVRSAAVIGEVTAGPPGQIQALP